VLGNGEITTLAQTLNPVWVGILMGGTSVIATALEPSLHFIFGTDKAVGKSGAENEEDGRATQVHIVIQRDCPPQKETKTKWQDQVMSESAVQSEQATIRI